jgi:hypothetical protein
MVKIVVFYHLFAINMCDHKLALSGLLAEIANNLAP